MRPIIVAGVLRCRSSQYFTGANILFLGISHHNSSFTHPVGGPRANCEGERFACSIQIALETLGGEAQANDQKRLQR
jgi:hypothetical protein